MSLIELKVPDIGGHENVDIIAVEIKAGDTIAIDDTLITLLFRSSSTSNRGGKCLSHT